jgi:Tfp pilus assembly protein PilZ
MDKRGKDRITKRLFVKFGMEKPDQVGFTEDISPSGLFIKCSTVLQPGSHVRIEIELSDHHFVLLAGEVVWAKKVPQHLLRMAKKSGMGIRLVQTGDDYKQFCAELGNKIKGTAS